MPLFEPAHQTVGEQDRREERGVHLKICCRRWYALKKMHQERLSCSKAVRLLRHRFVQQGEPWKNTTTYVISVSSAPCMKKQRQSSMSSPRVAAFPSRAPSVR